jgi:anti-anti-sigma factor
MDKLEPETDGQAKFAVATGADGITVLTISGELDISGVDALEARVAPVLERPPVQLIVDVSGLRFADSSAIALWVRWATLVEDFELRHPTPLLGRVIAGMGLTEKLAVTP